MLEALFPSKSIPSGNLLDFSHFKARRLPQSRDILNHIINVITVSISHSNIRLLRSPDSRRAVIRVVMNVLRNLLLTIINNLEQ